MDALSKALAETFDPPLDGEHARQVQEVINKVIEGERNGTNEGANKVYPYEEGDTIVLGPEIFASKDGKVINWKGENYVPQVVVSSQPPLKDYKLGEKVEVFRDGDWLPGFIQSIDKVSNHIHVHTDKGPKTIASSHGIRKLS